MSPLLATARFCRTIVELGALPTDALPEIAFVGRSNAGKSTALNLLCQRRRLAFASNTPGRTQALNYFTLGPEETPTGYLVDTPGYGFAATPQEVKRQWQKLIGPYLQERATLRGVVLMLDARRGVTELDLLLIRFMPLAVPLLALMTKADKLTFSEQGRALAEVARALRDDRPGLRTVIERRVHAHTTNVKRHQPHSKPILPPARIVTTVTGGLSDAVAQPDGASTPTVTCEDALIAFSSLSRIGVDAASDWVTTRLTGAGEEKAPAA